MGPGWIPGFQHQLSGKSAVAIVSLDIVPDCIAARIRNGARESAPAHGEPPVSDRGIHSCYLLSS